MASIYVDVDLNEFDTDEIVSEVVRRLKTKRTSKQLTKDQEKELRLLTAELSNALNVSATGGLVISSLLDQMKYDHISKVFNKYSLEEIESKLPQ